MTRGPEQDPEELHNLYAHPGARQGAALCDTLS